MAGPDCRLALPFYWAWPSLARPEMPKGQLPEVKEMPEAEALKKSAPRGRRGAGIGPEGWQ